MNREMELTSTEEFVELSEVGGKRGGTDRWQIPVAIASLLLGIAVSLQFRASSGTQPPSSAQRPDLIVQLRTVETENNRLSDELAATRERVNRRMWSSWNSLRALDCKPVCQLSKAPGS